MSDHRNEALDRLGIPRNNRIILSLDGGGIRGILTLQLLKKMEEVAGYPLHRFVDMVAGTSTGGIMAGLIALGYSAEEIEKKYVELVTEVFLKRGALANRFLNPPLYSKANYRRMLKEIIEDKTLQDAVIATETDIMITAKDLAASEETFFSCFSRSDGYNGTYKNVLLRAVMEATMSAPTYFTPLERFVDGGTTTYNNPTLAAVMEAVGYGGKGKYSSDQLTVFSFGTGTSVKFVKPEETGNPKGMDVAFWLNYIMDEASQDAADMQMDVLRSGLISGLDLRRFQLSLDQNSIRRLPNRRINRIKGIKAEWMWDLSNEELDGIGLDEVGKFGLMQEIGEAMAEYVCPAHDLAREKGNWFKKDLINGKRRDELVSSFGDIERIKTQMSDPDWLDAFPE